VKLLLDTNTFYWGTTQPRRLSEAAEQQLRDPGNERLVSAVTAFELATKVNIDKLRLGVTVSEFLRRGLVELRATPVPLEHHHASAVEGLPMLHRDPFDRLLIAQALVEDWPILTSDGIFKDYGVEIVW
jgi:PIN domain nuclease of toxin-antitoxin system